VIPSSIRKLCPRKNRTIHLTHADTLTQARAAALETKDLGDTKQQFGKTSSRHHLTALACIHAHWLFAKHRLAAFNR
jgi:hypothetical protein